MFKVEFNSLYVAAVDFVLGEKQSPTFTDPTEEIKHYRAVVDECNILLFNLVQLQQQIPTSSTLYQEVMGTISDVNAAFDLYREKSVVVRAYIQELASMEKKVTFFEKLYRFEQLFVSTPIIKIDVEEIQKVLVTAHEYVADSPVFYYFTNDPHDVNAVLGVIIPRKYSFDTAEKLLTSVYNYMYSLYMRHQMDHKNELESLLSLETNIENLLYELKTKVNEAKNNRIVVTIETTYEDYYNAVVSTETSLVGLCNHIVQLGLYRFTTLSAQFAAIYEEIGQFISQYKQHPLYDQYLKNRDFIEKVEILKEYIKLLEDGKIKSDVEYVLTNDSLKSIVEKIIELVKIVNKKIVYTQKYHSSGFPTVMEFEFYQTELFLDSVKSYYYQLMSANIYRYSNISIDEFGDSSIDSIRDDFKTKLMNYNSFISRDVSYLNGFEFADYKNAVVNLQTKLKSTAVNFYSEAIKSAHATYVPVIEKHYSEFLSKLALDLNSLNQRNNSIYMIVVTEEKRKAGQCVESVSEIVGQISKILSVSAKNLFLGFSDYINTTLYTKFKNLFTDLQTKYNNEDYVAVLNAYDSFFDANVVNLNILYAFEKFSTTVDFIFAHITMADELYVDQYTGMVENNTSTNQITSMLQDLFDDETYKVSRNEIFSSLDILYDFVISTRQNEGVFLINEKNLKKLYFDNQLMKMNFIWWFDRIYDVEKRYKDIDKKKIEKHPVFIEHAKTISSFNYKGKLSSMIENQNKAISNIGKMILEYSSDTNYKTVNLSPDIIKNIEIFNGEIRSKFDEYCRVVSILEKLEGVVDVDNTVALLREKHKKQWVDFIDDNSIIDPEIVSYNEMEPFKGTVPYTVQLKARMEQNLDAVGNEIQATFNWYIGGMLTTGSEITHTFFDVGTHKVRCDISYPGGETMSRFLEFNLSGPTNTQIIKSETVEYNPTGTFKEVPKLTFLDGSGNIVTIPVKFTGSVSAAIEDGGTIDFSPDGDLSINRAGLVILGFDGTGVAGDKHDVKLALGEKFEYPDAGEAEFLFDFVVSSPIGNAFTVNTKNSKFVKFMAKVPPGVTSVYSINKGSTYDSIGTLAKVTIGDKLILKNGFGRWSVVEIEDIISEETPAAQTPENRSKYDYTIKFKYFVNTSLENSEKDAFRPEETNMIAPTLVFKASVREVFNKLVARLEEMNALRDKLKTKIDTETRESINAKLIELDEENKKFYLFEELDKVKSKIYSMQMVLTDLLGNVNINYDANDVDVLIERYKSHVTSIKLFGVCVSSIEAHDFKKNIVDLEILISLYKEQQTIIEIIVDTYNYKIHDVVFYENRLKDIKLFSTGGFVDKSMEYGPMLVNLVKKLRELLFKIKTVINFPIMSEGKHLVMSDIYYRLTKDLATGMWVNEESSDFYLFYKKLELQYGYSIEKVESGKPYKSFISDVISLEKDLFGTGLSTTDVKDISNYIQVVESNAVAEYDDFFLIPFWIDYLEKNV